MNQAVNQSIQSHNKALCYEWIRSSFRLKWLLSDFDSFCHIKKDVPGEDIFFALTLINVRDMPDDTRGGVATEFLHTKLLISGMKKKLYM